MTTAGFSRAGHGPPSGVTVLDLSGYIAGPYGGGLLDAARRLGLPAAS